MSKFVWDLSTAPSKCKIVQSNNHTIHVCLFGLMLNVPVNSYCHVGTVISPNHTFFLGKLD